MYKFVLPLLLLLSSCSLPQAKTPLESRLRGDLESICNNWTNGGREETVEEILKRDKIKYVKQRISYVPPRFNYICNPKAKGSMFLSHLDCTDGLTNIFRLYSLGVLDFLPPLSSGAFDSGGAVAVCLELARRGRYVCITSLHESGAQGAKVLASSMDVLPKKVFYVALVGGSHPTVAKTIPILSSVFAITDGNEFDHQSAPVEMIRGLVGNGPLGLLPNGGWLRWRGTEVIWIAGPPDWYVCDQIAQIIGSVGFGVGPPFFRYHGLMDHPCRIDLGHLAETVEYLDFWD